MPEKKNYADSEIIATSFGYPWSRKRASQLFLAGNLVRLVSVLLLIAHALSVVDKKAKSDITYSLLGFALLQWFDILVRYPLSVKEYEQARGVIMFTICYVILSGLYVTAIFNGKMGLFVLLFLATLSAVLLVKTHSAAVYERLHQKVQ